jgi:trehalose 6-phosphate synthase
VNSFLSCCEALIQGARVDYSEQTVRLDGRVSRVRAYPISINVAGLRKLVSSAEVKEYESKLRPLCGEKTIVRIDRAEPSKNIVRGFRAFDILLGHYPEFLGRVKFIAFLVPTRTHIRQYQRYIEEIKQLIEDINDKYRTDDWYPIDYFYENNYYQAVAGMRLYDVLLINAVIDGMNLVAKEGPTINDRGGVLVLSETVGACEQLGGDALTVAPADLEGTTRALHVALTMLAEERERRARALKESIAREDITAWLLHLLEDIASLV